jgi:hypothetical protein
MCKHFVLFIILLCAVSILARAQAQNAFTITATWYGGNEAETIDTDGGGESSPTHYTVAQGSSLTLLMFYPPAVHPPAVHIDSVYVDGVWQPHADLRPALSNLKGKKLDMGPSGSYIFTNVTANHILKVVFADTYFNILATAGPNGIIDPAGSLSEGYGGIYTFTLTPNPGFKVDSLIVDAALVTPQNQYRFNMLQGNHTIRSTFTAASTLGVPIAENNKPADFQLDQNFPNPFNPTSTINYQLPNASFVHLSVFNILGQQVRSLVNQTEQPGYKSVSFDATNLPSGIYFYRITAGSFADAKKMILIK